ncbi:uncharacterized protein LOC122245400, partial [Penaeus japonicus]|uniref:uncharacterized protein LOC122245400 n=1 Tax=Penaeus japonicus TaxID=27405 RepID=UPI001C7143E6
TDRTVINTAPHLVLILIHEILHFVDMNKRPLELFCFEKCVPNTVSVGHHSDENVDLVLLPCILIASHAAPQGYDISTPSGPGLALSGNAEGFASVFLRGSEGSSTRFADEGGAGRCKNGELLHVDGKCVVPITTRNIFLYDAPKQTAQAGGAPPNLPPPKVDHNILFVRLPEGGTGAGPFIIPPPQQENIIYVLSKNGGGGGQRVIEVTAPPPSNPEVYFVNYGEGDNPTLPIGVDLETALSVATEAGGLDVGGFGDSGGVNTASRGSSLLDGNGFGGLGSGFQSGVSSSYSQYSPPEDNSVFTPSILYSEP